MLTVSGPLLVVSPHFDDVQLSCFSLIARREPMTVLHACTGVPVPAVVTDWDRKSGFGDSDEANAVRRAEEREAFAGTPHRFREVGVLDDQYTSGVRTGHEPRAIGDAVAAWIDEVGTPCSVAVPVGAGRTHGALVPRARLKAMATRGFLFSVHPDHVAARDGALEATRDREGVDVLLYEELPYRFTVRGDRAAHRLVGRFGPAATLERIDVPIDRSEKARRLRSYASQLPLLFPRWSLEGDRLRRVLPPDERYWRVVRRP